MWNVSTTQYSLKFDPNPTNRYISETPHRLNVSDTDIQDQITMHPPTLECHNLILNSCLGKIPALFLWLSGIYP